MVFFRFSPRGIYRACLHPTFHPHRRTTQRLKLKRISQTARLFHLDRASGRPVHQYFSAQNQRQRRSEA